MRLDYSLGWTDGARLAPRTDPMSRRNTRQNGMRTQIAAVAARLMAEDGIDDFGLAKRKAARQMGVEDHHLMPGNDEIEAALEAYRDLYQADEHPELMCELLVAARDAMRLLGQFNAYLTGPVLKGSAGPHSEITLQLFPESSKEVEIFLIDHNIAYDSRETRRFAGDRRLPSSELLIDWNGFALRLSVFDPREERVAMKTSQAGRVIERAGLQEVEVMLDRWRAKGTEAV